MGFNKKTFRNSRPNNSKYDWRKIFINTMIGTAGGILSTLFVLAGSAIYHHLNPPKDSKSVSTPERTKLQSNENLSDSPEIVINGNYVHGAAGSVIDYKGPPVKIEMQNNTMKNVGKMSEIEFVTPR